MGSTSNDNRKVNVIKMSCLPKMNYLSQSPPIQIPLSYLKQVDRICKAFIWNSKRLWMLSNKLQRPAEKGSLGLPNVLLCFYAFDLRHQSHLSLSPEKSLPWYAISILQSLSIKLIGEVKNILIFHTCMLLRNAPWIVSLLKSTQSPKGDLQGDTEEWKMMTERSLETRMCSEKDGD